MAVGDYMKAGISSKQRVKILTVDPATRRIEGALKDGSLIQIALWEIPSFFRWPQIDELWTVYKENGYWMLGSKMDPTDGTTQVESLSAGQARVNTDVILTPSGYQLVSVKGVPTNGQVISWSQSQGAWVPSTQFQHSTSLPSSPQDGQVTAYQADATNGVRWLLRYNASSASAYKWEYIGGPPLFAEVGSNPLGIEESTVSTTYTALATAGPSLALPLGGDYMVALGAVMRNTTAGTNCFMSYDIGGTAAADGDALAPIRQADTTINSRSANVRDRRKTALSTVTLTAKYRVDSGTGFFNVRWMRVTPVRVG